MSGPLEDIRILDLSWVLAGPFCTMHLSDLGAEVIKLERPNVGDLARGNGPFIDGESSYFMSINRGKKSITIDLQTEKGKELFLKLMQKVDVIVENFVPGTMKRLGLDYDAVKEYNPRIIYASLSGFGQSGPHAQNRALDVIIQAAGGLMSITGETGGPPIKPGASIGDLTAGLFTAIGILAALHEREKSGKGQYIDISMLDCQLSILENAFARYFATGEIPKRLGTRHAVYTPFQAFETKDGYIVIAMVGGVRNQWPLFCAIIGRLELMDDERYQTGASRTEHYDELATILEEVLKTKTTNEWIKELSEVGIPCGPINNIAEVAADPQVEHRNMIIDVPHPKLGKVKMINTPVKLSRTPGSVKASAPELGQDTREILVELLGLNEHEINELNDSGII
ncbi:MAG: carnitine dehydratase [Chloroflexi bacterium RBG_13_46_14]|nr:MAG: carnitine dehydratase [Chloroflexi bacterium RBG_13_46_14]